MKYEVLQIAASDIPDDMRVNCPKRKSLLRQMRKCFTDQREDGSASCEYCLGVVEPNPDHNDFRMRYRLACNYPVLRNINQVAED